MSELAARWRRLLSHSRLGRGESLERAPTRTEFQVDHDRIIFSSAFRRLQDKTQVFPLAENDYVRTRLTHSLEVSCVGRSLGTRVGEAIIDRHGLDGFQPADFGAIVAAACLGHDIGNPPFGHTGEDAIRHWFETSPTGAGVIAGLDEQRRHELLAFEGNAQGLRVLTRLQSPDNPGGMQLTTAVLAAFTKYPRPAHLRPEDHRGVSVKKYGFFRTEQAHFAHVAADTGLRERLPGQVWQRHPLAFLVEAADDISYHIIDLEDGFRQGYVPYETIYEFLAPIIDDSRLQTRLARIGEPKGRVEYLRARAIGALVEAAAEAFLAREEAIVEGSFDDELVAATPFAGALATVKSYCFERVYTARPVLEVEAAGYQVLGGLLELFAGAMEEVAAAARPSQRARTLLKLLPAQFVGPDHRPDPDPYERILRITDFVAGMTDGYAVGLYRKVSGIALPRS